FDSSLAGVGLVRADGRIGIVAMRGPWREAFDTDMPLDPRLGVVGAALREGRPYWTTDTLADPTLTFDDDRRDLILRVGQKAALATPLRYGNRTIGVLAVTFSHRREFSDQECALTQAFADQAAVALENARLYEEAERKRGHA